MKANVEEVREQEKLISAHQETKEALAQTSQEVSTWYSERAHTCAMLIQALAQWNEDALHALQPLIRDPNMRQLLSLQLNQAQYISHNTLLSAHSLLTKETTSMYTCAALPLAQQTKLKLYLHLYTWVDSKQILQPRNPDDRWKALQAYKKYSRENHHMERNAYLPLSDEIKQY